MAFCILIYEKKHAKFGWDYWILFFDIVAKVYNKVKILWSKNKVFSKHATKQQRFLPYSVQ